MARHNQTGNWGENVAVEFLVKKGYDILERNWRLGKMEIDIIAKDQQRVIFVEVKTRSNDEYIDYLETITRQKTTFMRRCSTAYMEQYPENFTCQFDYIFIVGKPDNYIVEHYPDAFFPPMKTYR